MRCRYTLFTSLLAIATLSCMKESTSKIDSISMTSIGSKYTQTNSLTEGDIASLAADVPLDTRSSSSGYVVEPALPAGVQPPHDTDSLGFGRSRFLVDTRWVTFRYVGNEMPAGAGLTGNELNTAQKQALGKVNDSIPVVTAAWTINHMMEDYFAPLLKTFPEGAAVVSKIKVQGAWHSPSWKPATGEKADRDNAFVVGLQSMHLYPSSCFEYPRQTMCGEIYFSAGHDPTVIGHELGHVIFRHLRGTRYLNGFEWYAIDEGLADYFSAAFFSEPILGRIWKISRHSQPYMRQLLDAPTSDDPVALQEEHAYSVVWSSTLWRIRTRIAAELKADPKLFDSMVLYSITQLGEINKTAYGDAATKLILAANKNGHPEFKTIMAEEFQRAQIDLVQTSSDALAVVNDFISQTPRRGVLSCGTISHDQAAVGSLLSLFTPLLLVASLFLIRQKRQIALLVAFIPTGCSFSLSSFLKPSTPKPPSNHFLQYRCLASFTSGVRANAGATTDVYLTVVREATETAPAQILISDRWFKEYPAAIVVDYEIKSKNILRITDRNGEALPLQSQQVKADVASDVVKSRIDYAHLLLEEIPRSLSASNSTSLALDSSGNRLTITRATTLPDSATATLRPAAATVKQANLTICELLNL